MEFELQRLSGLGLQIVYVRLRCQLQVLALNGFLEGFVDDELDGFLSNRLGEALTDHRWRRLTWAKPGQSHLRGVLLSSLIFV